MDKTYETMSEADVKAATGVRLGQLGDRIVELEQEVRANEIQRTALLASLALCRQVFEMCSVELLVAAQDQGPEHAS